MFSVSQGINVNDVNQRPPMGCRLPDEWIFQDLGITTIWASAKVTDLAPRRLVTTLREFHEDQTEDTEGLKRYLLSRDLGEPVSTLLSSPLSKEEIIKILEPLDDVQLDAIAHILSSPHGPVLIQRPPGTGKTTLISSLVMHAT